MENNEEFFLQPAGSTDFPAIKELIHSVGINPTGLVWKRFIIAIDKGGALIGCGQIKPHRDGSLELASIAVVRTWRRQGVASAIIHTLIAGKDELFLTCRQSLVPFYEQFGFRRASPAEMSPHFSRIFRLARIITTLGLLPAIAVMKRNSGS